MTTTQQQTGKLPRSWLLTELGELGLVASGSTPSTKDELNFGGDIPWITPADLSDFTGKFISHGRRNLTERGLASCSAVLLPKGSILFSSRAPIGYVVIARNPIATNQGFKNLVPVPSVFNEYVLHYLKGNKRLAESHASGTTFLEISALRFGQLPLPLPPSNEQRRIVAKIEELFTRLDAGIEELQEAKKRLASYRQAVLRDAFTGKLTQSWREAHKDEVEPASVLLERTRRERRAAGVEKTRGRKLPPLDASELPLLPQKWGWARFDDLREPKRNALKAGPFGSSLKKEYYVPSGYKIYGQEQVIRDDPFYGDYYIDERRFKDLSSCAVAPGDVLVSLVGTIGKVLVLPEGVEPGIINPRLVKLSLDRRCVSTRFIKRYLRSHTVKEYFSLAAHGGTMDILNLTILRTLPIPLPPVEEQQAITDEADRQISLAEAAERTIEQSLRQAERLRQSILKRSFEGRLVLQDPTDEPAEKLLERIKAEKAKMAAESKGRKRALKRSGGREKKQRTGQDHLWEE